MKKITLTLLLVAGFLSAFSQERYREDWDQIATKYEIPEWFKDAKFGIFIHWGVYSVPAYGSEWYARNMYIDENSSTSYHGNKGKQGPSDVYLHHVKTYGHPSEFGYKDFIPQFKAELFDAGEWLDIFEKSGAKYIVPVAEHHDAFAMYNSSYTIWNSVDMGPKRDIVGELQKETAKRGMKFGVSSHLAFNQDFFTKKPELGNTAPKFEQLYGPVMKSSNEAPTEEFKDMWMKRTTELIDNYQPDILWFDFGWDRPEYAPEHLKLTSYYYNKGLDWNKEVVLQGKNHKFESLRRGSFLFDMERSKSAKIRDFFWQTDTSIGKNSWGYVSNWESKETNTLIDDLVDIVSKNGSMLLNVGPKSDGTIPYDQQKVLLEMGDWLKVNGEAIYGSRPFSIYGEGPTKIVEGHLSEGNNKDLGSEDIRYTMQGEQLYAFLMEWPKSNEILIKTLAKGNPNYTAKINTITMMGSDETIKFKQTKAGLKVILPSYRPCNFAYGLKIN
ncbi:alpha-L-fucosidase [Arcticibacterium luteifluviistationis]|uniref:alpha-L-fucosidase n=1 Tax=Arcticibacterium luteifluviistationis TaxID=1784714 RepID=A0A2Z4GBF8_9BACT|nr:alpha-L-fucosidase [Arcticibacterium luteifluviistationis]AWV98380.1 alpha-L-fucosidase [Arcticibacterium luteifluviistationis]